MKLEDIQNVVEYNHNTTEIAFGKIKSFDFFDGKLKLDIIKTYDPRTKKYKKQKGREVYTVNEWAKHQTLERLKVNVPVENIMKQFSKPVPREPSPYKTHIASLPKNRDEIISELIKLGIKHQVSNAQLITNMDTKQARGVVSSRYHFVPNRDVFNNSVAIYGRDIDQRFSYIGDKSMKISYKSDMTKKAPISEELVSFGYNVGNSEVGCASLSVFQFLTFLRCSNGLILNELKFGARLSHTNKQIEKSFIQSMNKFMKDFSILDEIDKWYQKPMIIPLEAFTDEIFIAETQKKIDGILQRYGITTKDHRIRIAEILKERQQDTNAFQIGDAVNYYASNILTNEVQAEALLYPAYQIMIMQ